MSKQNYDAKLEAITAISDEDVKSPDMPLSQSVQEAEDLSVWCEADEKALKKAGLDWALVEDLPFRAGACRYAQSLWAREGQSVEDAQKEWKEKSPEAYDLRNELLHHFTFAYRDDDGLISKVQAIRAGHTNADMLQDLSDLKVLGKDNPAPLKAKGVDLKLLDKAGQMADNMSAVLARANGESGDDGEYKDMRDRSYTHMKEAVDEIRATGQYVFWRDDDRKKGYVSAYKRRHRSKNNSLSTEE